MPKPLQITLRPARQLLGNRFDGRVRPCRTPRQPGRDVVAPCSDRGTR